MATQLSQFSARCANFSQIVSTISTKYGIRIPNFCTRTCRRYSTDVKKYFIHLNKVPSSLLGSCIYKSGIPQGSILGPLNKASSFPLGSCIHNRGLVRQLSQGANDNQLTNAREIPPSRIQSERALSLLGDSDKRLSGDQWKELQEKFMDSDEWKTRHFENNIIRNAAMLGYYQMGQSFFDFLRSEGAIISEELAGLYLSKCIENNEIDHVIEWYGKHRQSGSTISQTLMAVVIRGYVLSDRWRESREMLKLVPKSKPYGHVIAAACRHGDLELVMELVREMKEQDIFPLNQTIVHILEVMRTAREASEDEMFCRMAEMLVMNMLNRHSEKRTYPNLEEVKALKEWFNRRRDSTWQIRFGGIHTDGSCKSCKEKLTPLEISDEEFATLKEQLVEKVIKGSDIFRKTTPEELEAFMKFIDESPKYDIIIDGLNIAKLNNVPQHRQIRQLYQCIVYLVQECGHKCLVLGRQHMLRAKRQDKFYLDGIQDLADCFFTENLTKDDPFMLYATLSSGPEARYTTYDMLRDHKALFDEEMNTIFYRWQMSRQLIPLFIKNGKIAFKRTFNADVVVQSTDNSWHIPYDDGSPRFSYQRPITWMCARKSHNGKSSHHMGI